MQHNLLLMSLELFPSIFYHCSTECMIFYVLLQVFLKDVFLEVKGGGHRKENEHLNFGKSFQYYP